MNEILDSPDEILSTLNKDGSRKWIYPTLSKGLWWKRRLIVGYLLIFLFIAMPIVKINGHPAILFDIFTWKFSLFGLIFSPTDTELLMVFGLTILVGVLFVTALFGRVWCGWGCPQTVYLEFIYRPIETFFEGKPSKRRRTDSKTLGVSQTLKKVLKWIVFFFVSLGLAHVFVAYIAGWERLGDFMTQSPMNHPSLFGLMSGMTALILFDFGYFREQMCTITCPYARLQSVLIDKDSMIISYDPSRGEPRGKKRQSPELTLGDCIDCNACVRTCPTGIDIRNGLQMECIGCVQCVDACDEIMTKIEKPIGLIRYTSESALAKEPTKLLRPRVILYGILLTLLLSIFTILIAGSKDVSVKVLRTGGAPFTMVKDDVLNSFKVRIENNTVEKQQVVFDGDFNPKMTLFVAGGNEIIIDQGSFKKVIVRASLPKSEFKDGSAEVKVRLKTQDNEDVFISLKMIGPK